jgi:hypothetical protein
MAAPLAIAANPTRGFLDNNCPDVVTFDCNSKWLGSSQGITESQ